LAHQMINKFLFYT